MAAEELAEILQDLLCKVMDQWNLQAADPLRKLPWENLDPISRQLYIDRCREFLDLYRVSPKSPLLTGGAPVPHQEVRGAEWWC